jgi:putative nucleotidyltransferase with HDIG domain
MTSILARAGTPLGHSAGAPDARAISRSVWAFVAVVTLCGVLAIAQAITAMRGVPVDVWLVGLTVLTIAAGRFVVKVPGQPATVSMSEVFVFTSVLLFGPAPATLTVAIDGLWIFFTQKRRRLYRGLFNVAEPAISTWVAGIVFFAIARVPPLAQSHATPPALMLPAVAMAATYFLLNSVLQSVAVALESGESPFAVWSQHALYLGINYYAAASLAALAVQNGSGLNVQVIGLLAPLLLLSYAAYNVAASRIGDSQQHSRDVEHLYQATVETLAIAVDAKDQVTHGHIRRVQRHTMALARDLGMHEEIELHALEAAALLHDVGKLAVPDYVLNKPGALSHREFETMKLHATVGATILSTVEFPYPVVPVVRHHHEQWCGKGYPDGLAGENIPLGARILTVVDCFDALTSDRPYRRKLTDEEAIGVLLERRGTMYDPRVVDQFIAIVPQLRRDDRLAEHDSPPLDADVRGLVASPTGPHSTIGADHSTARSRLLAMIGPGLVAKLARAMPAAEACLFAFEPADDLLVMAHATPLIRDAFAGLYFLGGQGLSGWVAANRHSIINSQSDLDLGDAAPRLGLHACTSSPVFALGNLVGVLSVHLPTPRGFSDSDVLLVGALAQEIGLEVARREHGFTFGHHARPARPRSAVA